jgi:hypothetical protein
MRTAGLVGTALWLWLGYAAVMIGVPLVLGLGLVWWTTRGRDARRARRARLIGLGVGALVGMLAALAALGFLAPIAVVAGYLVGVFQGELRDAPAGPMHVFLRQPRTMRSYQPRWAALLAIGAAGLTLLTPAILLAIPTATYGPRHPDPTDPGFTLPGATLKWPSIRDWLPLAVVAAGALVAGALLIHRVLRLPAGPSGVPESRRRSTVRTIIGVVAGIELIALGAVVLFVSAGLGVPVEVGGVAYLVSRIMVWTGLGLAVTGIGVWLALSAWRRDPPAADTLPQA